MAGQRIILHCDLNCFYASVELLSRPELREQPVAVCGDPASRHGIILAKNEPAKRAGVKTAETLWQAREKCPGLVLLRPHHALYQTCSQKVNAIYEQYTDLVELFGIDESWLDLTGSAHLFGQDPKSIADGLRERVRRELGLTLSIGVSFNKVFAKLGSDYQKPDATTVIPPDRWREIVWPLPVGDLLYVGQAAQKALSRFGVTTIGELAACSPEMLETLLGKLGTQLHTYANGLDREPVRSRYQQEPVKSVGNGQTFARNLTAAAQVRDGAALLADGVAARLRRNGLYAGGVQVTIRTPDFKTISRQQQLAAPTHLTRELTAGAMELIRQVWKPPTPIRMLTITAIHLMTEEDVFVQGDLFAPEDADRQERHERLEQAMDAIRGKFGEESIQFGRPRRPTEGDPL